MKESMISDLNLQLVTGQIFVGQGILLCFKLGVFDCLSSEPIHLSSLAKKLKLSERSLQALISCAACMGLINIKNGKYQLTDMGAFYLDSNSPFYYGGVFEELIRQNEIMNYKSIEKAILTNQSQVNAGIALFGEESDVGNSESFVKALHQKSLGPAFAWSKKLSLNELSNFVDLGGGSGVHSIAACIRNPKLFALVCDRSPVLKYTQKYINEYSLQDQIKVVNLNLWEDAYPSGDAYFLGDIFHDWPKEKCLFIAKRCYERLPKGGMIILHEMLFDEDKMGPLLSAAYNMKMMMWTEGQQYTFSELKNILEGAKFSNVKSINTLGNWSIVYAYK